MTARPASGEPAPVDTRRSGLATDVLASGRVVDMILGLTVLEAGALGMHHRRTGRGIAPADLAGNLLAGIGLLLALRAALSGARRGWVAAALAAALAAHLADLRRRWGR